MDQIVLALIGALCIGIGISNRRGNLSTLHSYHRSRVSEEDRLPFGKLVGLGMILIGIALILVGVLFFLAKRFPAVGFLAAGNAVLVIGLASGLAISFYAMIRYNKGIF